MIDVTISADSEHRYTAIKLLGHAGNAKKPVEKQEIVCAAVSALVLNMSNSVEHFTEDLFQAQADENSGSFLFEFLSRISPESELLMNSLVFGLMNIEEQYGEPYIKICIKEV